MKRLDLNRGNMNSVFSPLETDILNYLWKYKEGRSNTLHKCLKRKHKCAHTTIAVTLDRMYKKKILSRKKESCRGGTRYVYSAKISKKELGDRIAGKFLKFLKNTFGDSCVASLKTKLE